MAWESVVTWSIMRIMLPRLMLWLIAAFGLNGCASIGDPPNVERIRYEYGSAPFCGRCETRLFTITVDDRVWIEDGHWAGAYSDWRVRRRVVQLHPGAFDAFRAALAPWRPAATVERKATGDGCADFLSDGDEVRIVWSGPVAEVSRVFESGCRDAGEVMAAAAVRQAVAALALPD